MPCLAHVPYLVEYFTHLLGSTFTVCVLDELVHFLGARMVEVTVHFPQFRFGIVDCGGLF